MIFIRPKKQDWCDVCSKVPDVYLIKRFFFFFNHVVIITHANWKVYHSSEKLLEMITFFSIPSESHRNIRVNKVGIKKLPAGESSTTCVSTSSRRFPWILRRGGSLLVTFVQRILCFCFKDIFLNYNQIIICIIDCLKSVYSLWGQKPCLIDWSCFPKTSHNS